ncbi:MAG: hypothetical protein ACUVUU_01140 [bacterium]
MRVVILICMVICLSWSFSKADSQYPTNLEIVEKATKMAVDSINISGLLHPNSWVKIEINPSSDAGWLVESILKERFIKQGIRITGLQDFPMASDSLSSLLILNVRVIDIGVKYEAVHRKYILFGKKVERIARAAFQYDLFEKSTGTVLHSSSVKARVGDVIPASAIPLLSDSKYGFASPSLEKSKFDKYIEGGLVLSIIGVLIYLFYTNKTAS